MPITKPTVLADLGNTSVYCIINSAAYAERKGVMAIQDSIILYSTGCPRCMILKEKLKTANISFIEISDEDTILRNNIDVVPVLEINGARKNFSEAIRWIDNMKGER